MKIAAQLHKPQEWQVLNTVNLRSLKEMTSKYPLLLLTALPALPSWNRYLNPGN